MASIDKIIAVRRIFTLVVITACVAAYAACSGEPKSRAGRVASASGGEECKKGSSLALAGDDDDESGSGSKKKKKKSAKLASESDACGQMGTGSSTGSATGSATGSEGGSATGSASGDDDDDALAATENWLDGVKAMSDDQAIDYLKDKCGGCHDATSGKVRSFWELDSKKISKEQLIKSTDGARVYAAIVFGAKQIVGQKPSPMPQGTSNWTDEQIDELKSLVKWFDDELPAVASAGADQFGVGGKADGVGGTAIKLNFKCANPSTFRQFIGRLANDAFSRPATTDEIKLAEDPDAKATKEDREKIAAKIFSDKKWKAEFVEHGLKKFADKLAGVSAITPYKYTPDGGTEIEMISDDQAKDLKNEFYEKLKKEWESANYRDILTSKKVMVTAKTAPLYGCSAPSGDWGECDMKAPRDSFFTTIGYLRSKPSSVLSVNNNYGRSALMIFVIRGDVFKSANDQDGGAETLNPLPACLKTNDHRVEATTQGQAPFGATSIPNTANLCQSCHIDRQMAAGSILFRPFNRGGLVYKTGDATLDLDKDEEFKQATDPKFKNRPKGPKESSGETEVTSTFLHELVDKRLSNAEYGCVPKAGDQAEVPLKEVGDLAKFLIGPGKVLAGGLARHIPRAISNVDSTSEEIVLKFNRSFTENDGKLAPLFEAYFASETFACEKGE